MDRWKWTRGFGREYIPPWPCPYCNTGSLRLKPESSAPSADLSTRTDADRPPQAGDDYLVRKDGLTYAGTHLLIELYGRFEADANALSGSPVPSPPIWINPEIGCPPASGSPS